MIPGSSRRSASRSGNPSIPPFSWLQTSFPGLSRLCAGSLLAPGAPSRSPRAVELLEALEGWGKGQGSRGANAPTWLGWSRQHCEGLGDDAGGHLRPQPRGHGSGSPRSPPAPGAFCSLFRPLLRPQLRSCTGSSPGTTAGDSRSVLPLAARCPATLGSCPAPGPCLDPAAPGASPAFGVSLQLPTQFPAGHRRGWGEAANVGHAAATPLGGCLARLGADAG